MTTSKVDNYKQRVQSSFNRAAATYDQYGALQFQIGLYLIKLISQSRTHFDQVIDLGCGTGNVTEKLAQTFTIRNLIALDFAEQLLTQARDRLSGYNACLVVGDFETFKPEFEISDLAFSSMALHWSANFDKTLRSIYSNLNSDGLLAFSIPLHGTFIELPESSRNVFYTESAVMQLLKAIGFDHITSESITMRDEYPSVQDALMSIKRVGANCLKSNAAPTNGTKKLVDTIQGTFSLTYEIGYFIARK